MWIKMLISSRPQLQRPMYRPPQESLQRRRRPKQQKRGRQLRRRQQLPRPLPQLQPRYKSPFAFGMVLERIGNKLE
ncbi:uncharacterized protein K444DRAFT_78825 [Hyaloscypha bicolor E]|uniref:Uncharacterized protein n=1 Tax=Hyaloscypha bicolor E TaxID=1095630 RepID=A0A2J6SYB0_9HELO|nr:uncharacterized protein K444DRAFT_78825 [Hyaloscypha bicolor E]PMD55755.1 hypothetical protein K444DRAFT_78825 [Hyaloscypha bicolor E]